MNEDQLVNEQQKGDSNGEIAMWKNWKLLAVMLLTLVLSIRHTIADGEGQLTPIDLLKVVDPAKDAINGTWSMENGVLKTADSGLAHLEFRYAPPKEYDYRVVFVVEAQRDALMLICCGNGHQFAWVLNEASCGFSAVNGKGAASKLNETVNRSIRLVSGRKYTTVVKVRSDSISAYLDDTLVSKLQTDFSNLSLLKGHKLRKNDTIGLATSQDAIRFESAVVIEVSAVPPSDAQIATSANPQHAAATMPASQTIVQKDKLSDVSPQDIAEYRQQKLKPVLDQIHSLEPLIAMLPKTANRPDGDLETRFDEAKSDQAKILAQSDDSLAVEIREKKAFAAAQAEEQRVASDKKRARVEQKNREKELLHDQATEAAAQQLAAVRESKWPGWHGPWKQCPFCGGTCRDAEAEQEANNRRNSALASQITGTGQITKVQGVVIECSACGGTGSVPDK